MELNATDDMFHKQPYSFRAICPEWVVKRGLEISVNDTPDVLGALNEALQTILVRVDRNLDESREPLVYFPDHEGEPYMLLIPILNVNSRKIPKAEVPVRTTTPNPNNKRSSLRMEFEESVFEMAPNLEKSDLARDVNGKYKNAYVNALWEGFKFYHNKFTQANSVTWRENYQKTLGRYVLAKVGLNGVALFNRAPYRHMTLGQATTEAERLVSEFGEGFGIFRCIDVIGKPTEDLK